MCRFCKYIEQIIQQKKYIEQIRCIGNRGDLGAVMHDWKKKLVSILLQWVVF